MGQGLEEGITVLDLKGDLLDQPLARASGGHVHAWRGGADDEVVVHVVKAQKGRLRPVRALVAIGDPASQHLGIEAERALEIRYQNPHMSDALQLDTHGLFSSSTATFFRDCGRSPPPGSNRTMPTSRSNHELQTVSIRVMEVDAAIFPRT